MDLSTDLGKDTIRRTLGERTAVVHQSSNSANDITAWTSKGSLFPSAQTLDSDLCGSIVPAGMDSDVWDIFAYDGKVFSKKREGGAWESISFGSQTSYSKHFLMSIYSVSGETGICWLWTQNTTGTIEVFFDIIPEFGDAVIPAFMVLAVFVVILGGRHRRCEGRAD